MARTWCIDCGAITTRTRCATCNRAHKQNLYGGTHAADRRRWQPHVDTGNVRCWRCGLPITHRGPDGQVEFDLGHRRNRPSHPEHPRCNRAAH